MAGSAWLQLTLITPTIVVELREGEIVVAAAVAAATRSLDLFNSYLNPGRFSIVAHIAHTPRCANSALATVERLAAANGVIRTGFCGPTGCSHPAASFRPLPWQTAFGPGT